MATYYEILGVDPTATPQQIKDAYRRLAMKYHPDRWAHATDEVRRAFTAAFQQVQEAYDCLIGAQQAKRKPEPKPQDPPWSASDAAGWRERTAPRRKSDTFGGAWKFSKRRCALVGFILLVALHFHISVATLRLLNNKPHDPAILNETLRIPCIAYTRTEAVR